MGRLIIHQDRITPQNAPSIVSLCPFGAITYDSKLDISSACKMCKLCVRKSDGAITFAEDETVGINKTAWNGVCVYADHADGQLHRVTLELLGKARELADVIHHPVYALLIGREVTACAEQLLRYGVDKVFVYDDPALEHFRIEPYTAAFCDFIDRIQPSSILVGATNLGRQLAPRVAARCRTGLTADCTILDMKENTDLVQIRPAFGGNIMAQIITTNTRPQFCTVRYKVFDEPQPTDDPHGKIVPMAVTEAMRASAIEVLATRRKPTDIDIAEADIIVAVGRGACGETMLAAAHELADLLGGVVACSRPLVENNTFDAKHQIGLSGRTVKPKLIFCFGISGAVQFAAGMKSSDCIVAVNTDPNAPIFDVAHVGVVGDATAILPMLIENIKEGAACITN